MRGPFYSAVVIAIASITAPAIAAPANAAPANVETEAQFYKGKIIRFIIGSSPGGNYDTWARLMGRHLGKYIPGKPKFIAQNMPGGGHIKASNYLYNIAAKDGTVIRASLNFTEMTPEEYAEAIATSRAVGTTPPDILDKLRGKQVWIDHGHGIVTRYVHLSGIASEIVEGKRVRAGDIVGFVGNSGTEAAVNGNRQCLRPVHAFLRRYPRRCPTSARSG